jgi:predicted TIM-barrel fold metal-dependent hydrolase
VHENEMRVETCDGEMTTFVVHPDGEGPFPVAVLYIVEMSDTERLFMFSTDYPHYDADSADIVLPRTLSEEPRRRVRYQNALETYPRLAGFTQ